MSYQETYPAYIAPVAFEKMQPYYQAVHHDPEMMQAIAREIVDADGHMKAIEVSAEALIYRWISPGFSIGKRMDRSVRHEDSADEPYYPTTALATPDYRRTSPVMGSTLAGTTLHRIRELDLARHTPPVKAYAQSMLYPPAEDLRLIASPKAWVEQVAETTHISTTLSVERKRKLIDRILIKYSDAIVLEERPGELQPGRRKLPIEA